ncbi:DNA recombination protein RmuC [Luteibacter sp. HA06]
METMPGWGWALLAGVGVIAAAIVVIVRAGASAAQRQLQARLELALADASRFPDAQDRATRAESRAEALTADVSAAAAREAGLVARANEAAGTVLRLEAGIVARDGDSSALREAVGRLQRELATANATSESRASEVTRIRQERDASRAARDETTRTVDGIRQVAAVAEANLASKTQEAAQLSIERDAAREELRLLSARFQQMRADHATAASERDATREAVVDTKAFLARAQAEMRTAFTEAASKVFDEKSLLLDQRIQASSEVSKVSLEATLKPFAEKVTSFQAKVEQLGTDQAKEHAQLVGTIGELKGLNQNMATAAEALTRALKGNAKTRGDWGELILETVLKGSGLEEGKNYVTQMHTVDEDTNQRKYPDVVVNLPDGRRVVVDSKMNFVAWTEAQDAQTPEGHQEGLIRHAAALRAHMRELSDKNYPKVLGADALDLTILFVPIEGALSAALSVNPDLQTEAFAKKVVFASPNTLMAMLRVVERLWTRDRIQRQVGVINEEATKLLDALGAFMDDFDAIETRLRQTGEAYSKAKNRLNESNQSVVSRAQRLVAAGARPKKSRREELLPVSGGAEIALALATDGAEDGTEASSNV